MIKLNKTRIIILFVIAIITVGTIVSIATDNRISNLVLKDKVVLADSYGYNAEMFKVFDNANNVTCYITLTNTIRGAGISTQCSTNFTTNDWDLIKGE